MSTSISTAATGTVVVDDSGVRIGTADDNGQVHDFAGVHVGAVTAERDGAVADFAGVRIGHLVYGQG